MIASSTTSSASSIRLEVRSEAAFIAHRSRIAALLQHALQRVENLGAPAQRFGKFLRAVRHNHELLRIHGIVGVRAAVQDVHHRHRQQARRDAAQIAIQRRLLRRGRRARHGHRDRQNRVRAQLALVRSAVQLDHVPVDRPLAAPHPAQQRTARCASSIFVTALQRAFAQVARLIAVAKLDRFMLARRCAGGNRRAAHTAIGQINIGLHRRIAAAV